MGCHEDTGSQMHDLQWEGWENDNWYESVILGH